jgi:Holliday junction resolvase
MVSTYRKGSRAERELIEFFSGQGYSVIRAAGSGVNSLSPDILVFRRGAQFAFEAKAIEKENLGISKEQFQNMMLWEENTGITCLIAWRRSRKPWHFLPLSVFNENPKSYAISWKSAGLCARKLCDF